MSLQSVRIESFGYELPPQVWSSALIEEQLASAYERLRLPAGRLELMTGIRERRFWDEPVTASQASAMAGKVVLEKTGVARDQIDLLVHCGVCRDRLEPATAAYVHHSLGLSGRTQIFDLSNACLGFLNACSMAAGWIASGQIRSALLVSGENGRPLLERTIMRMNQVDLTRKTIKPWFANLTIGAGNIAFMLTHESLAPNSALRFKDFVYGTDSNASVLCQGDSMGAGGLEMLTEAEALLEAGINLAGKTWQRFTERTGWSVETPDHVITHQVGKSHQRQLFEALSLNPGKDFVTYPWLGNIGSVSLPITLCRALEAGVITGGQRVALLGIGSGLSCCMAALEVDG